MVIRIEKLSRQYENIALFAAGEVERTSVRSALTADDALQNLLDARHRPSMIESADNGFPLRAFRPSKALVKNRNRGQKSQAGTDLH